MNKTFLFIMLLVLGITITAEAGPIFLTGHDPDFHSQGDSDAADLLRVGIDFVRGSSSDKFLWVESDVAVEAGHRRGKDGLSDSGFVASDYDWVTAATLNTVDFSLYSAIVIASDFGGMLTQAELNILNSRESDIKDFVNSGGGLMAMSEGHNDGHTTSSDWFDFLPIDVSSTVSVSPPYSITTYGATVLGLTTADVNTYSHSLFLDDFGLNVVSRGSDGSIMTLAGNADISDGGFTPASAPVPEPGTILLLGLGLVGLVFYRKERA